MFVKLLEWISYYETSEQRVSCNIVKYKIPFEQAVKLPVVRIVRVKVNGVEMLVKDMWESFNLKAKTCSTHRSHHKLTFIQTLQAFGVDTSNIEIEVL